MSTIALIAVIYCRVSTKEQTKNLSLPAQGKACAQFCEAQGWQVAPRERLSNPLIAELTAFESLRTAGG